MNGVTYIGRNSTVSTRHRKNQRLSKTPPLERVRWLSDLGYCLLQALMASNAFGSTFLEDISTPPLQHKSRPFQRDRQRHAFHWRILDIYSNYDYYNYPHQKHMDINVYSFSHMLVEYELFRKTWADF